ncbi:uncharacterized protein Z519_09968 [Cladophialophora bantiana CBS 173.52]|uniref:Glucose-methanol-choline oxidoreductase C-terminal domain-containing protein n=1 Tax=Cladophialophora bantiana (strain ATCC 10958 / CBS 173.52 / CDC B-1940 / NIH 8579) TaxID=1442370 RepID=A0A0D2EGE9_CLAB1|nr:uncharacterized protein Z519_09968 [Cladophialophora bantiana CBS 173.52]KIW89116.1 hypothetical protein Z519_09968 [Cladophialophora bantiana CBS 173.52]
MGIGIFKSKNVYDSNKFKDLPPKTRRHLLQPTVPSYEITLNAPLSGYFDEPANTPAVSIIYMLLTNSQCRGCVELQSSDRKVPLPFDPKLFSSACDRRVAVGAYRGVPGIIRSPAYAKDTE